MSLLVVGAVIMMVSDSYVQRYTLFGVSLVMLVYSYKYEVLILVVIVLKIISLNL